MNEHKTLKDRSLEALENWKSKCNNKDEIIDKTWNACYEFLLNDLVENYRVSPKRKEAKNSATGH